MNLPDGAAIVAFMVAILLGLDRVLSALGRIGGRFSGYRAWRLRRARRVVAQYDQQAALQEIAMNAEALQALIEMAPKIDAMLAQLNPNHGGSLFDKVGKALEYAERAGEAIDRLDAKLDKTLERIDEIDKRVTMME